MEVRDSQLRDVKLLRSPRHVDNRGFFSVAYSKSAFTKLGIEHDFMQDNHSLSRKRGVVRGLHFQIAPFAQAKLLRVLRGSLFDVAVDIRDGSPSYGQHAATVLNAEDWDQIFIPAGFAHGFCTLQADTEILYKVDHYYSPAHEGGIRWNDPMLGIAWPVTAAEAELSDRDKKLPLLADLGQVFTYAGKSLTPSAIAAA
jgi:dTDP-4-dehydrorhamnose 3,5-epimerase